jgi:hypothetical protein
MLLAGREGRKAQRIAIPRPPLDYKRREQIGK